MSNSLNGSTYQPFSANQMKVLTWWHDASPVKSMSGLIADGAIRSGKTFAMGLSFVFWAMANYDRRVFALCGRTQGGVRRNLLIWLLDALRARGFFVEEHRSDSYFLVRRGRRENRFYLFGGQNEASQALIQGMTLAGALFDEVALMPESFVNQATGRCSIEGAKLWFNCNPQGPFHWFKCEWIDRAEEKGLHYIHFTMDDNPSLTPAIRERYRRMYTGAFYNRYILGFWEIADGAIYDMWDESKNTFIEEPSAGRRRPDTRWIGVDYGTTNPMVFLDARFDGLTLTILNEYYYDSKKIAPPKDRFRVRRRLRGLCRPGSLGPRGARSVRRQLPPGTAQAGLPGAGRG